MGSWWDPTGVTEAGMDAVGIGGSSYSNPATAAQPYLDNIPGYVDQYMQPFIDMGQTAGGIAQQQYGQMASDPTGYYDSLYQSYEPSDYYQYMSDQLGKTQQNTAAAGGFSGTTNDQNQQMTTQNALMNYDWNQYLEQVLGIQSGGLQGEQQMYNTGFQASNNALEGMTGYANASATNQAGGIANQNAMKNAQSQALLQAAGLGTAAYMLA